MTAATRKTGQPRLRVPRRATVGAAICAGLLLQIPAVRTAPVPIIDAVEAATAASQALGQPSPANKRSRAVRVNLYPLPTPGTPARGREEDLELALFPDVTVHAVFDRFDTVGGSGTWMGHVAGVPLSSVALAYRDGLLTAHIDTRDAVFLIEPMVEGDRGSDDTRPLHVVSEVVPQALPLGHDTIDAPPDLDGSVAPASAHLTDSGDVVDLMVLYTPAAMADAGGPAGVANSIALQVAETNAAFANSGVPIRMRLVHTALVPHTEAGPMVTSIDQLMAGSGPFSGVEALRDAHGADLVSLLVRYTPGRSEVCGIAVLSVLPGLGARYGYSAIGNGGCIAVRVLAHELGHNFGANHDWYVSDRQTPFPFGKGHVDTAQRWHTIMAYGDRCRAEGVACSILNYFSNPDLEYIPYCTGSTFDCDLLRRWFFPRSALGRTEDQPVNCRVGVIPDQPCAADNRRVFNITRQAVANYRPTSR